MSKERRPWIKRVDSNIKSPTGTEWSLELGQHTLLVGSNTSHKSAVIQAVELALTAAADDIVGRSAVKDSALLMSLAPHGAAELESTATLTDGTEAYFKLAGTKRPTHDTEVKMKDALPLRQVRKAMQGSTDTARKAFVRWAAQGATREDILGRMATTQHGVYGDLAEHIGKGKSEIDTLIAVLEYVEKRKRDCAKEQKGAQIVVDSIREGINANRPDEGDIFHWESEVHRLRADIEACLTTDIGLPDAYKHAPNTMASLAWAMEHNLSSCPACSSAVGAAHISTCWEYYSNILATVDCTPPDVSHLDTQRKHAEAKLSALREAETKWDQVAVAIEKVEEMKSVAVGHESLLTALKVCLGDVLAYAVPSFCDKVQCFLPSNWLFDVNLLQDGREVFRMGLVDEHDQKKLRCALSGAEWATVTTAIAMAMDLGVGELTNKSRLVAPRVLIPEDRAWDGRTLSSVMRGFSRYDGQVVMASTIRPKGRSPKGWTIIDMDDWLDTFTDPKPRKEVPESKEPELPIELGDLPERNLIESTRAQRILRGLGYVNRQISCMTATTAAKIISGGHMASCAHILPSGEFELVESHNLIIMPRAAE
tara:strand:- start:122 stop:1909 length:1788 start_codon:yes stop_codon:yes gene_type:complete